MNLITQLKLRVKTGKFREMQNITIRGEKADLSKAEQENYSART